MVILLPLAFVGLFVLVYPQIYSAAAWRYGRRRRVREEAAIKAVAIPADVPHPRMFPDVAPIDEAQARPHIEAVDQRIRFRGLALLVCTVPALAAGTGAVGLIFGQLDAPFVRALAVVEVALLGYLVWVVSRRRAPTTGWVLARMRSEMLRREQYLCLGRIGPYQGKSEAARLETATARVALIEDGDRPSRLPYGSSVSWFALASTRDADCSLSDDDLPTLSARLNSYLWFRVRKQKAWFSTAEAISLAADAKGARLLKLLLSISFSACCLHVVIAFTAGRTITTPASFGEQITLAIGLFAAPLCSVVVSVRETYHHGLLAASYARTRDILDGAAGELEQLAAAVDAQASAEHAETFRGLVARTELVLLEEYEDWESSVSREEFDASV